MMSSVDLSAFLGFEAPGVVPNCPIAQFEIGDHRNFIYLVIDWATQVCMVVDPQEDLDPILSALKKHSLKLNGIILTHTHFDHVAGVAPLLEFDPELPIFLHEADSHRISEFKNSFRFLNDQEAITLGNLKLVVLHTPGHSAGEVCIYLNAGPGYLLTGDTLFIRDCGRTDLPTGNNTEMFESLQKIKALPPSTLIFPGHHYVREVSSTLARELLESAPLKCKSIQELTELP